MLAAGDTTAKLLTLAHSDPDYRLYLPLFELNINMFPSLPEHLAAFFLSLILGDASSESIIHEITQHKIH